MPYSGNWNIQGGNLRVTNSAGGTGDARLELGSGDTIQIASGSQLQFDDTGSNIWQFRHTAGGNGSIELFDNNDTLRVIRSNDNTSGGFSPGASAGILTVNDAVDFQPSSIGNYLPELFIEVTGGGAVAGTDFDRLVVLDSVTNISNLELLVDIDGSLTQGDLTGDLLEILTSTVTDFTGQSFASVTSLNNNWTFDVLYEPNQIVLSNFVFTEQSEVVPEPSTFALALLPLAALAWYGWRRGRGA